MPSNERIARPLILALILAVGLGVIWGALAIWISSFADGLLPSHYVRRTLSVLTDGTPYLSVYERGKGSHVENLEGEQVDLDGPESTINCAQIGTGAPKPRPWSWRQPTWRNRINMFNFSGRQDQHWYFIREKGSKRTGYFVGYDTVNHQRIGYLGIDGWHEQCPASSQCFPLKSGVSHGGLGILARHSSQGVVSYSLDDNYEIGWPSWMVAVRMGPRVDVVNLRDKTVQTVFENPHLLAVSTAQRTVQGGGSRDYEQLIAMRLPEKITFLSLEGDSAAEYQIPPEFRPEPVAIYLIPGDKAIFVTASTDPVSRKETAAFLWTRPDGEILDRKLVTLNESSPRQTARTYGAICAAVCPAPGPLVPVVTFLLGPQHEKWRHPEWTYAQTFQESLRQLLPVLITMLVLSCVLTWLCVRRQHKYALPWTKTWAVFVFFFGIPGYLAYLAHRPWPVREECAECHRATPRDREACPFCHTSFPAPEPKGIEIFA